LRSRFKWRGVEALLGTSFNSFEACILNRYCFIMESSKYTKGAECMNGQNRKDISPGIEVDIVLKKDQRSGNLTRGTVKDILTNSSHHPHGIKVRLQDGQVGRVKNIV